MASHLAGAVGESGLAVRAVRGWVRGAVAAVAGRSCRAEGRAPGSRGGVPALAPPLVLGGVVHVVTASVGMAVCPRAHADLSALLRVADQRMYANKRSVSTVRGMMVRHTCGRASPAPPFVDDFHTTAPSSRYLVAYRYACGPSVDQNTCITCETGASRRSGASQISLLSQVDSGP